MPRPVVAAAIVDSLAAPTMLLAAQRAYPKSLEGFYELPGGKVEPGESPLAALHREIEEELGTHLRVGQPVANPTPPTVRWDADAGFAPWPILDGRVMWVWMAQVANGALAPRAGDSHRHLRWVGLENVLNIPWLPTNKPIITYTLEGMNKRGEN